MKALLEKIIKIRNPQFAFDNAITSSMVCQLITDKGSYIIRGLLHGRRLNGLLLGRKVRLQNRAKLKIGQWVKIDDYCTLNALGKGYLSIGNNTSIGAFSRVIISTSFNHIGEHISIGNNVGIGEYAYLGGGGGLDIGDNCIVGQYLSCHPENHHYQDTTKQIRHQGVSRAGIKIGQNCWIGSKVTITDGVTIGDNCVLAAGAVITKDMPANSVIGGVPAKVIKTIS